MEELINDQLAKNSLQKGYDALTEKCSKSMLSEISLRRKQHSERRDCDGFGDKWRECGLLRRRLQNLYIGLGGIWLMKN